MTNPLSSRGRAIELYLMDGSLDGMVMADMLSWSGHVVRAPRTRLSDLLRYPKARQPGVYLLVGEDDRGPLVQSIMDDVNSTGGTPVPVCGGLGGARPAKQKDRVARPVKQSSSHRPGSASAPAAH